MKQPGRLSIKLTPKMKAKMKHSTGKAHEELPFNRRELGSKSSPRGGLWRDGGDGTPFFAPKL